MTKTTRSVFTFPIENPVILRNLFVASLVKDFQRKDERLSASKLCSASRMRLSNSLPNN